MESPFGQNIVVFDCEIKNEIDGTNVTWKTFDKMGHAVSCLYDYQTMDYKIYMDDNADEMIDRLNSADLVTGFAIKQFDIPLLNGTPEITKKITAPEENIYDMLEISRRSLGWTPGQNFPSGLKLDQHLEAMFGAEGMKSGHGANAPILWQKKQLGALCSYVIRDVNREKALFEHMWKFGTVKTFAHGEKTVWRPQDQLADILTAKKRLELGPLTV